MTDTESGSKLQVLIVDDNVDNLTIMTRLFESAGANVVAMQNPIEAKDRAVVDSGKEFDLMVLDIRMPNLDGNELAREIRSGGYKGPIIAFTANATGSGRTESEGVGINRYFSKETLNRELIEALLAQYCG